MTFGMGGRVKSKTVQAGLEQVTVSAHGNNRNLPKELIIKSANIRLGQQVDQR